jgi:hypothetical protein
VGLLVDTCHSVMTQRLSGEPFIGTVKSETPAAGCVL